MNLPQPHIAHFDIDSFFVSVEVLKDPTLKGKAVVVGGSRERGVVTTCSYEARKFGVHSAMPMKRALQLCPHAILVRGSRADYSRYSRMVTEIIAARAPLFQKASIDEFFIDLSGMDRFFDPFKWAIELRNQIIETTCLPISFGLASNKMIAKIATDEAKPNGYLRVLPGFEKSFLAPLKVNKIPGVGEHTYQKLVSLGVQYIRDIETIDFYLLEKAFGNYAHELVKKANGIHIGKIEPYHEAKSISTENTFEENLVDMQVIIAELVRMVEKLGYELRKAEKLAGCIAIKIRYSDFSTFSRQTTIDFTTSDDEMLPVVKDLFAKLYTKGRPIRLLGVRLSELTNLPVQASLFIDTKKKNDLYKAVDGVKDKFGNSLIKKAATLESGRKK